jgi:signal transduction histidine kinase
MMADQTFTILLVDDRMENLVSLEEMLTSTDRRFLKATSGNEALKLVLKYEVGLILLDVQMPEMDGFEVARLLKLNPKTKDVSIIFVTAISKEEKYVMKGFSEGAVDYLHKPLDIDLTRAKVLVFEKLYRYQQKLKKTASDLQKVNSQLERFSYVVSHDLKTPLASLIMLLDMCSKNEALQDNAEVKMQLDIACQVGHQLSGMINSILEYSRQTLDQQKEEEVNTTELLHQIEFTLGQHRKYNLIIKDDMPVLKTNRAKLQQVFQNLIGNAIKYGDKDEVVIEIGTKEEEDFYVFYVADNGPGLRSEDTRRIFKLFEVGDNKTGVDGSTGVGLNLLKMLVEEQGGKIWVESQQDKGSIFFFEWRKA